MSPNKTHMKRSTPASRHAYLRKRLRQQWESGRKGRVHTPKPLKRGRAVYSASASSSDSRAWQRHESKKRLRRAVVARNKLAKLPRAYKRGCKNAGRANRHIYTNKDM